jgi:serine/threonine-protein kinase
MVPARQRNKQNTRVEAMTQEAQILRPGEILANQYVIQRAIGSGGYAVVYEAERIEDDLPVAVKAMRRSVADMDPKAAERFTREAKVAALLDHPNIVKILDAGSTDRGVLYMVLERLYGYTLSQIIYVEPTHHEHVRQILIQVLSALAHAHDHGIVHRDIKPSNIFICEPDENADPGSEYHVKILDFGLTKSVWGNRSSFCQPLTMAGEAVGTPGYLAPEMLKDFGITTPQVDLYAVGLLGYEMLTGQVAFSGTGVQRAYAQLTQDPTPPPKAIKQLPLFKIVKNLIERDPSDRYLSAVEALDDLENLAK